MWGRGTGPQAPSLRDAGPGPNQAAGLPGLVATEPAEANGGAHRHYHRARRTYEAECMSQRTSPGGCGQSKRATAWTANRRHSGRNAAPSLSLLASKAGKEFILRVKGEFLEIKRKGQRIVSQFTEGKARAANKHVKTFWASPPPETKSRPRGDSAPCPAAVRKVAPSVGASPGWPPWSPGGPQGDGAGLWSYRLCQNSSAGSRDDLQRCPRPCYPWRQESGKRPGGPCRVQRPCGPGSDSDGRHVDTLGAGSEDEGLSSLCRVSHATWPNAGHFL